MKPFYMSATRITLLVIVLSIVILNFLQIEVWEPLKSMALMVISFYFGQKVNESSSN
jgi:hypothetical protein